MSPAPGADRCALRGSPGTLLDDGPAKWGSDDSARGADLRLRRRTQHAPRQWLVRDRVQAQRIELLRGSRESLPRRVLRSGFARPLVCVRADDRKQERRDDHGGTHLQWGNARALRIPSDRATSSAATRRAIATDRSRATGRATSGCGARPRITPLTRTGRQCEGWARMHAGNNPAMRWPRRLQRRASLSRGRLGVHSVRLRGRQRVERQRSSRGLTEYNAPCYHTGTNGSTEANRL